MRLLQINGTDAHGTRFTGISIRSQMEERGIDSRHYVWRKETDNPYVTKAYDVPGRDRLNRYFNRKEKEHSLQSVLHRQWATFPMHASYRWADIIHYHIIHDGYFSTDLFPRLTRNKPSVWTLHDPWAMTGHCVYPYGCTRWQIGCGKCPDLRIPFAIREDKTHENFLRKQQAYDRSNIDVVVASEWMLDIARASPLMQNFRLHKIPFGIDLDLFRPKPNEAARRRFGIIPGNTVIFFRAASVHKGLEYIIDAIRNLKTTKPITILSVQEKGCFENDLGRHQIIETGWIDDESEIIDMFSACDIFLMPSVVEAFGLMAIEAMASGKPVISFEGTSLPSVTAAPECGIAVPARDSLALAAAIDRLVDNPAERIERGRLSRIYAEKNYSLGQYADNLCALYQDVINRRAT